MSLPRLMAVLKDFYEVFSLAKVYLAKLTDVRYTTIPLNADRARVKSTHVNFIQFVSHPQLLKWCSMILSL